MAKQSKNHRLSPKDILAADFKSFEDSFWKNETVGETRVQFFVGLVTAVIGGLVTLATTIEKAGQASTDPEPWIDEKKVTVIALFALSSLLIVGWITFLRMVRRNCVTDEYKGAMDYIRKTFVTPKLQNYTPFLEPEEEQKPKIGGLSNFVAIINGLILAALIYVLVSSPELWETPPSPEGTAVMAVLIAVIVVSFKIHWAIDKRRRYKAALYKALGLKESTITRR